jgi:16S rRNA processing protein RimM
LKDLINIATISGTHHLKGALKANSFFEELDILPGNKVIAEGKNGVKKLFTIKAADRLNEKKIVLEFEEIKSKTEAQALNGFKLYIRRDLLSDRSDDEFYLSDIIDMDVVTVDGENLGKVADVFTTAAHDIYVVSDGENEIMIPAVEEFIKNLDFDKNLMTVELIEGLRDL